jgi:hypothetical protein
MLRRLQCFLLGAVLTLTMNSVSFGKGSIQPPTTVGAQMGTLNQGTASSATFSISNARDGNGTVTITFTLQYVGPPPTGVTFSAPSVTDAGNGSTIPATATFTTSTATQAGSYPFTITASDGTNIVTSNQATLVVGAAVPEIDSGAAAGALTVVAGLYLMIRDRRWRRTAWSFS